MDYLSQEIETQHLVAAGWEFTYLEATMRAKSAVETITFNTVPESFPLKMLFRAPATPECRIETHA